MQSAGCAVSVSEASAFCNMTLEAAGPLPTPPSHSGVRSAHCPWTDRSRPRNGRRPSHAIFSKPAVRRLRGEVSCGTPAYQGTSRFFSSEKQILNKGGYDEYEDCRAEKAPKSHSPHHSTIHLHGHLLELCGFR